MLKILKWNACQAKVGKETKEVFTVSFLQFLSLRHKKLCVSGYLTVSNFLPETLYFQEYLGNFPVWTWDFSKIFQPIIPR